MRTPEHHGVDAGVVERGEVGLGQPEQLPADKAFVWNAGAEPLPVPRGMRIAQLVFARFLAPEVVEADALAESDRGTGGFGSTGH